MKVSLEAMKDLIRVENHKLFIYLTANEATELRRELDAKIPRMRAGRRFDNTKCRSCGTNPCAAWCGAEEYA